MPIRWRFTSCTTNFVRIHQSLRVTPAMEAGITGHLWELSDIVDLIAEREPAPGTRGPYRKRCRQIDSAAKHEAEHMRQVLSLFQAGTPEPELECKASVSQALLKQESPQEKQARVAEERRQARIKRAMGLQARMKRKRHMPPTAFLKRLGTWQGS